MRPEPEVLQGPQSANDQEDPRHVFVTPHRQFKLWHFLACKFVKRLILEHKNKDNSREKHYERKYIIDLRPCHILLFGDFLKKHD